MSGILSKNFNLPWHQHEQYCLVVFPKDGNFSEALRQALQQAGCESLGENALAAKTPRDWKAKWDAVYGALESADALEAVSVSLTPGEMPAEPEALEPKSVGSLQAVAQNLWLGHALREGRIMCYLQPVMGARDKIFGYESFARVKLEDGSIIAGDKIVAAARALGIEHMIDRHLHVAAIKTFISSAFNGFLFINFFPGFIHRPSVYLEGLTDTVQSFGVVAKHIVLDITKSEMPHDGTQLKSICEYGRQRGYSIALDDINSVEGVKKLLAMIRPDFVKIDMSLARQVNDPEKRQVIYQIVELAHVVQATVIGEGVETEETYQALRQLGVDLFQGYLFSPPVPVEAALGAKTTAG